MLPSLTVKPVIWDKWCDGACAYWEPTQEPDDFRPGIAIVVCYSPFQDLAPRQSLGQEDHLHEPGVCSGTLGTTFLHGSSLCGESSLGRHGFPGYDVVSPDP